MFYKPIYNPVLIQIQINLTIYGGEKNMADEPENPRARRKTRADVPRRKAHIPRSHKHGLMVSLTPKRGLHVYFQKRASGYNMCIGDELRGRGGGPGSGRAEQRGKFTKAVATCK